MYSLNQRNVSVDVSGRRTVTAGAATQPAGQERQEGGFYSDPTPATHTLGIEESQALAVKGKVSRTEIPGSGKSGFSVSAVSRSSDSRLKPKIKKSGDCWMVDIYRGGWILRWGYASWSEAVAFALQQRGWI